MNIMAIYKPNIPALQEKYATISGYISNAQIAPNLLISIYKLWMSERRKGGTSDVRSALAGGDGERQIAADEAIHAAGRITNGIDRRAGLEFLQFAAVEHDPAER